MNASKTVRYLLVLLYILIGTSLFRQGSYPSLLVLTIALSLVAPSGGITVTFASAKVRILIAVTLFVLAILLLAV